MAADVAELTGARALDALHLAGASRVESGATALLTLDTCQAQAARALGLTVVRA